MEEFTVISLSDHKLQCKVYWHNIVPVPFRIYLNKPLGDLTWRLLISWLLLAGGEWLGRFAAEMPERGRYSKGRTLPVPPVLCGRYVHYRFRQYAMEGMFTTVCHGRYVHYWFRRHAMEGMFSTGSSSTLWKVCSLPVPPACHGRYVHYRFRQYSVEGMFTTGSASTPWKVCSLPVPPVRCGRYVHQCSKAGPLENCTTDLLFGTEIELT